MKKFEQKSASVFTSAADISEINLADIELLKSVVAKSPLGRVRINLHADDQDLLHEMFIAIDQNSYVRVHKHANKSEAFHIVYGAVKVIIFNDDGSIKKVVHLSADSANQSFYYRMSKPFFHTLMIESEMVVLHEITNGPFIPGATIYADFSPEEHDTMAVEKFRADLIEKLRLYENATNQ